MEPERWGKIESIFHKALEAEESRRAAVLEESRHRFCFARIPVSVTVLPEILLAPTGHLLIERIQALHRNAVLSQRRSRDTE